jgi:flagellar protein FliO/FliZ
MNAPEIYLSTSVIDDTVAAAGGGMGTGLLLQMFLALGFVVVLIYGLGWLINRLQSTGTHGDGAMRLVGGLSVGSKERIVLLEVNGSRLLVGVAPGFVGPICTLSQDESADTKIMQLPERPVTVEAET